MEATCEVMKKVVSNLTKLICCRSFRKYNCISGYFSENVRLLRDISSISCLRGKIFLYSLISVRVEYLDKDKALFFQVGYLNCSSTTVSYSIMHCNKLHGLNWDLSPLFNARFLFFC